MNDSLAQRIVALVATNDTVLDALCRDRVRLLELLRYLAMRLADLNGNVQELSTQLARTALLPTPRSMVFDVSDVDVVDFAEPRTQTRREL